MFTVRMMYIATFLKESESINRMFTLYTNFSLGNTCTTHCAVRQSAIENNHFVDIPSKLRHLKGTCMKSQLQEFKLRYSNSRLKSANSRLKSAINFLHWMTCCGVVLLSLLRVSFFMQSLLPFKVINLGLKPFSLDYENCKLRKISFIFLDIMCFLSACHAGHLCLIQFLCLIFALYRLFFFLA